MWCYRFGTCNKSGTQSSPRWTLHFWWPETSGLFFVCFLVTISIVPLRLWMKLRCNAFLKWIKMWPNPEKKTYPWLVQTNPWWRGKRQSTHLSWQIEKDTGASFKKLSYQWGIFTYGIPGLRIETLMIFKSFWYQLKTLATSFNIASMRKYFPYLIFK